MAPSTRSASSTVAVFSRHAVPGRVKTRLSPALPPALACALHRAMLWDTLDAVRDSSAETRVLLWAEAPATDAEVDGAGFRQGVQQGGDLGGRLEAAFEALLAASGGPVAIVGSDAPEIDGGRLDEAFVALEAHDAVLGPASDGGFYLIAARAPIPGVLSGIPWSTAQTFDRTVERLAGRGMRIHRLPALADVDTAGDLVSLIARCLDRRELGEGGVARHTRAFLSELGLLPGGRRALALDAES